MHQKAKTSQEELLKSAQDLSAALAASQKVVTIQIAAPDLTTLKESGYKLCFAKKLKGEEFNVVWQSYDEYLQQNVFSWTPQYQLFGSNIFKAGVRVVTSTALLPIGLGEESTLDQDGILQPAVTGGPATAITMKNDYGNIHPGLNQLSTGPNGNTVSSPFYVAQDAVVSGSVELTAVEVVQVWFEQNIATSTMFSDAKSNAAVIDLTETNHATRLYRAGVWSTP